MKPVGRRKKNVEESQSGAGAFGKRARLLNGGREPERFISDLCTICATCVCKLA